MRRSVPAVLALLLAVSALAAVPAAMAQESPATETTSANETTDTATAAPGATLSGAVGAQAAELDGEVESRAYGIRVAQANTDDARAGVVADQLAANERRIESIEDERADLDAARANGSIGEAEYRARTAALYAESRSTARLVNQTDETAAGLPAETLEANGVNATAIRTLSERAAALTGGDVSAIARDIAGPSVGEQFRSAAGNATEAPGTDRELPGGGQNATDAGNRTDGSRTAPDGRADN